MHQIKKWRLKLSAAKLVVDLKLIFWWRWVASRFHYWKEKSLWKYMFDTETVGSKRYFQKKKKKIERNNHLKFRNTFWNTRTINEHTVFGPFYQNVKLAPVHRFSNCKFLYTSKKNSPTLKVFFRHLVKVTLSPPRPELFNLLHWKTFKSNKFFFFTLKALFFLKIFTFLFCCFDHVGKADWLKR